MSIGARGAAVISASVLRNTVVTNYVKLFENYSLNWRGAPIRGEPTCEQVREFRAWLMRFIVKAKVLDPNGATISGPDSIAIDAVRMESIPPYRRLYPFLFRALNVLKKDQMLKLLGISATDKIYDGKRHSAECE